jgi:methyltransferase
MVTAYLLLLGAVALERLAELVVSARHARWAFARGGTEHGRGHFPAMVTLHSALLVGSAAETVLADRPFLPALGWPALAAAIGSQGLRWWCIRTLGPRWSTRVIIVPGLPLVTAGPYRCLRHPNYVAVVVEGLALPLVHTAWVTALVFTVLNAVLLGRFRIPAEERALGLTPHPAARATATGRERA